MPIRILSDIDALRAVAPQWDDLWKHSRSALPTVRAEPLAIYLESFAANARLQFVVVEVDGRFMAAMPLVEQRMTGLKAVCLPNNDWAACGDLLLAAGCESNEILSEFVDGLAKLPASLMWLNGVDIERADWRQLVEMLAQRGLSTHEHPIWSVGIVDIARDWDAYWKSRSRNHRRQIQRTGERLRAAGGGTLNMVAPRELHDVENQLRRGFELETRSWKATDGTCVLHRPEIFEFYCRQAAALAADEHLKLVFLEHQGSPIAFEYGLWAKGIYFSPKVAYDAEFAAMSPGQQLRAMLYEQFQENPNVVAVDFHGPLAEATSKWATRSYPWGRVAVALDWRGRLAIGAYRALRAGYRRARLRSAPATDALECRPLAGKSVDRRSEKVETAELVESI